MTAVSLINPYAPQPAVNISGDNTFAAAQTTQPAANAKDSSNTGHSSDQSGQGAGNGTGTGGAQLATLLKEGRAKAAIQKPTPRSVVEAQSDSAPATEFLARQAQLRTEAQAVEKARAAEQSEQKIAEANEKAAKADQPEFVMPNPLPTAPILQEKEP